LATAGRAFGSVRSGFVSGSGSTLSDATGSGADTTVDTLVGFVCSWDAGGANAMAEDSVFFESFEPESANAAPAASTTKPPPASSHIRFWGAAGLAAVTATA
jgi:hypothetical protein